MLLKILYRVNRYTGLKIIAVALLTLWVTVPALAESPSGTVVAPSNEFGDAGAALGNVWDMNSLNDVAWTQLDSKGRTVQYTLQPPGTPGVPPDAYGSVLRGVTPKGSDLTTAFYINTTTSIPSHIYRYLIYRSYVALPQPGENVVEVMTNARVIYSAQWEANWMGEPFRTRRYSQPQPLVCWSGGRGFGQWCTYFIDLGQNIIGAGSPNPWDWGQPGARVEAFGLWPHENWCDAQCNPSGDSPDYFYLDYVYLAGEIVAKHPDYLYQVRWQVADPAGGLITSRLYYQEQAEIRAPQQTPLCNAANLAGAWKAIPGGVTSTTLPSSYRVFLPLIFKGDTPAQNTFGSGVSGPYNQAYFWNLAGSAYTVGKVYYVCLEVADSAGHKSYAVSSAPVIKAPPPALLTTSLAEFALE